MEHSVEYHHILNETQEKIEKRKKKKITIRHKDIFENTKTPNKKLAVVRPNAYAAPVPGAPSAPSWTT